MMPLPMTVALLAATVGLTGLLIAGIAYAAQRLPATQRSATIWVGAAVVIAWAGLSVALAARGTYAGTAHTRVPLIAFGIVVPLIAGGVVLSTSQRWRSVVRSVPVPWLVGVQVYRVLGVLFVLAYLQHRMPGQFALPAGIGDIAVGLLAPVAAYAALRGDRLGTGLARAWNVLGIADLVLAVTLGFLTSPSAFQQLALEAPNSAISRYPFVLIPVFAVPASILLHACALWRLRSAPAAATSTRATWRPAGVSSAG